MRITFFVYDTLYATIFLKRRSGGALVKRITYHLREIWYALRYFREVDPVLLANPCDCPWRLGSLEQWLNVTAAPQRGESPHSRRRPTRGGMGLQVNSVLLANPFHRPWRQHLASSLHTKTCKFTTVLIEPTTEGVCAHSSGFCQFVFIHRFHATKLRINEHKNK